MESISTFSNGMSSDLSKQMQSKDTYLQALNFRALTEAGGSNGALVNIKGNECAITFPDLQPVFKLQLIKGTNPVDTSSNTATFDINGTVVNNLTIDNNTRGLDIYNFITENYPNCYQYTGSTVATKTFAVAYEDDYIVFYNQPVYSGCTPVASVNTTISFTYSGLTDGTTALFKFINSNGIVPSLIQDTANPYVVKVLSDDIIPIGSTFILDDIYILTATDNPTYGPAGVVGEIPANDQFVYGGAIWKLNIDDITKDSTLTLIYSNNIDFTKYHPVAPSAILGRYESPNIQRLYWTDFYNKIRTINVAQPQLMAMSPAQLYVFPSVSFEIPLLHNIGVGSLSYGTYELAYRLKKAGGAVTNYSQTSNMVHLIGEDPNVTTAASYKAYEGGPGPNTRSITWKVSNLDTSYDTIEYVILYRTSKTNLPLIYVKPEISIGLLTDNYVTIDNLSTYDTILLEDFLNLSTGFTHAKTVDTKDNRLFWGNVKYSAQSDISGRFDARAFRAKTSGADDIWLSNNGAAPSLYDSTLARALPQTEDCINEYYDNAGNESTNACFYKPGTTKLGGAGKYVRYEFGTEEILLSDLAVTRGDIADGWLIRSSAPFSNQAGISGMNNPEDLIITPSDSDNQTYPIKGVGGFKNPYVTSLMKGFQHEEIYRIGIQFFDKQGNPFFTEWVGDIKMPSTANHNDNPGPVASSLITPVTDFRNSFLGDDGAIYGQILYIKFEIDISSIKDFIGGYQMVRVERTAADKTILGSGMITNSFSDGLSICLGGGLYTDKTVPFPGTVPTIGSPYDPFPSQDSLETLGHIPYPYDTYDYTPRVVTFDCFDMINDNGDGLSYRNGDKLLVRSRVKPINRQRAMGLADDCRYRLGFDTALLGEWLDNTYGTTRTDLPSKFNSVGAIGFNPSDGKYQTGFDSNLMPYYILHYVESAVFNSDNSTLFTTRTNHVISKSQIIPGGNVEIPLIVTGATNFKNSLYQYGNVTVPNANKPGYGSETVLLEFTTLADAIYSSYFGCSDTNGEKLMGLYYRPNNNQYGGNTYAARTNNTYIACGSFIPITRGTSTLDNNLSLEIKCYGGDIHLNYWDHQKIFKSQDPINFKHYRWDNGLGLNYKPGSTAGLTELADFTISNTFCFPCTNTCNQGVRYGHHVDSDLNVDTYAQEDGYNYYLYHSNEKNVVTFFPKPLNFQLNDVWRNRVFFSELKFDNEIEDSWTKYLPGSFYDVEGNYGQIMALVSLKENMYFFQERGVGLLMINPVSMVNDSMGQNVKLGESDKTIQKHFYRAIDTGTSHQWSVYRSQSTISFVDARHKKIYVFNGESASPVSDLKGQRNFVIKRFHDNTLILDNPIINKGVLTTYDYYHNEFLYTFLNNNGNNDVALSKNEKLTLAYSEVLSAFTGMYNFTPNMYINSNKYLLSTNRDITDKNKIWLHNYGVYGNFYGTQYPCTLKLLFNEDPMNTKVLDNLVWMSEAVNDNNLWNDDLNLYPGSATSPSYPDDVNKPYETFNKIRVYNQYQNTDWTTLTLTHPTNNLRKVEQGFNLQVPRNKFNYDSNLHSTYSLFDPSRLTKTTFGERMRDKWAIIDLYYNNTSNLRFIIHNIKSLFRVSDR